MTRFLENCCAIISSSDVPPETQQKNVVGPTVAKAASRWYVDLIGGRRELDIPGRPVSWSERSNCSEFIVVASGPLLQELPAFTTRLFLGLCLPIQALYGL